MANKFVDKSYLIDQLKAFLATLKSTQTGDALQLQTTAKIIVPAINEILPKILASATLKRCATYSEWVAGYKNKAQEKPIIVSVGEDFTFDSVKYHSGSLLYTVDATGATWYALENVAGIVGELTDLTTAVKTTIVAAINELDEKQGDETLTTVAQTLSGAVNELDDELGDVATLETLDKASAVAAINENKQNIDKVEAMLKKALTFSEEMSAATFWDTDTWKQAVETYTDEMGATKIVPKVYRIYDGAVHAKLGNKFYQANSIIYATTQVYNATEAKNVYDWKIIDSADGTIGDIDTLTTYIINADKTTTEKKATLVEAVNANKSLIGDVEDVNQDGLKLETTEVLDFASLTLIVQNIINKIGTMSGLKTYEKQTLMSGIMSALTYIGTKAEQDSGIALSVDPSSSTLINAVNTLGNWLGDPKRFDGVWGDGTKDLTSVLYELVNGEVFNHIDLKGNCSYSDWETTYKSAATAVKGDTYVISDDFVWDNGDGTTTKYKAGSWIYLYSTVGSNQWKPLNNGGGNDYIYVEVADKPTTDIKTDVIYVIPNAKNKKECWLYLGATNGWLKISSDDASGNNFVGTLQSDKATDGFTWGEMTDAQKKAVLNAYLTTISVEKKTGVEVSVKHSDRATASGTEPYLYRGTYVYEELADAWNPVFEMPIGSTTTVGIVKLASDAEYGDDASGVAVQPSQIKQDLSDNYYKNTEVDTLLDDKADKTTTYLKTETYSKTETDSLLQSLTKTKFVDFDPSTASPAVIAQYLGYTLYYGNDTDGYEVYVVDTDGAVKHVGKLKVTESGVVLVTDPKYIALADLKLVDDEGNALTVQAQIDGKQDKITDVSAISALLGSALTANKALVSSSTGKVVAHAKVTATEIGYLEGVTENIQQQIDNINTGTVASGWNIGDLKMSMQRSQRSGDWLLCDGTAYLRTDYQDLFDVIGRSFSEPTLDAAMFRVPNMQGRVPRGVDNYSKVQSLDYAERYVGADTATLLRTDLPNATIYTDTDNTSYDGRHGHARGDFSWYDPGNHQHKFVGPKNNYGNPDGWNDSNTTDTGNRRYWRGYNTEYNKDTNGSGSHTHYKDSSNGTYINSSTTSKHQHKIKLNGGTTQTNVNTMQATCNVCNYYIKFK